MIARFLLILAATLLAACSSGRTYDETVELVRKNFEIEDEMVPLFSLFGADAGVKLDFKGGGRVEMYSFPTERAQQSALGMLRRMDRDCQVHRSGSVFAFWSSDHPRAEELAALLPCEPLESQDAAASASQAAPSGNDLSADPSEVLAAGGDDASEAPDSSGPQSAWSVTEKVNPLDDSKTTVLSLRSSDSVPGMFSATHPTLIFRSLSGELSAYIATEQFLGSDSVEVITRIDKAPAEKKQWSISTDNKAVFAPDPGQFLTDLRTAEKLVVSLTPYSSSPITFTYDLTGLDTAAAKLTDPEPDAAASGATEDPADEDNEVESKWRLTEKVNPLDDSKTTVLALESSDSVAGMFESYKPVLILRQQSGELSGYIVVDQFLGSDSMEVTTRIDKARARKSSWGISTDHKAVFAPKPRRFLSDLSEAKRLVVSLTPYSESPITFRFDLHGLSEHIEKLK